MTAIADRVGSQAVEGLESDASPTERLLVGVLAEVLEVSQVSVTSNFFDDLEADSLVMAHFCARLTKREDLPSVSIKTVYQHPTIRSLAASVDEVTAAPVPALGSVSGPPVAEAVEPVDRWQYVLCGVVQVLVLSGLAALASFVFAQGFDWVSASSDLTGTYVRSAVFGGAVFVAWATLGIVAKWVLVGRWKPEEFRLWGVRYLRFWFAKILVRSNPLVAFVGTPLYTLFLRALGAKIGRNVVILSRGVPVCADLLTIGDDAVVRKDSLLTTYRAHGGLIQTGPVSLGANAFVGELTVLDIYTSLGDGAQIGHASVLHAGQSIPDGERRVGCPAEQPTEFDYRAVTPKGGAARRRATYSLAQLVFMFGVAMPLPLTVVMALFESRMSPTGLLSSNAQPFTSLTFFREALLFSLILFLALTVIRLIVVLTVPRILNHLIEPDVTYPMYGIRYWAHRSIGRYSNAKFFTKLFGDSSYIVHYLYLLGYKVSFDEQTGSNFGTDFKHDNPYNVSIGPGTMAADGLSIINADYSSSSFRVSPVAIGARSFIGTGVGYPSQGKTGENCLHASKLMVPVDGEVRTNVGFLGSPSFEIPRLVHRDRKFDDMKSGDELPRRLAAKNRHNVVTMGFFLVSRLVALFGVSVLAFGGADFYSQFGALAVFAGFSLAPLASVLYNVLVERASTGFKPLYPLHCSIYERESWGIERFWKLSWQPRFFNGTPMKSLLWRLLGARVGKRLFDDGAFMSEKTMITVGDDCVLNAGSVIQPHSQEDGSYKSDYVRLGDGCTLGVTALVHYGVTMGDGASLAPNAFLMKGTETPPNTHWGDNPARQLGDDDVVETTEPTAEPPQLAGPLPLAEQPPPAEASTADTSGGPHAMGTRSPSGRDYWRSILQAGENTTIPRWSRGPRVDEHEITIAADLVETLRELADELGVSISSILLASHAKVLAALAGEREVATGYVPEEGRGPLPCRLTTESESWRALVAESHRTESELLSNKDVPLDGLRHDLGLTEPSFETVFDPSGEGDVDTNTVLAVGVASQGDELLLRLMYRVDAFEPDSIARIAGYYLTALSQIAADPEADHRQQSLLSAEELHFQLEDLAGPLRELPDRRFHELFEEQVRAHPDAVAAVHDHQPWTYGELNSKANQLGRALVERGLLPETVVAVVTGRNLDWMAAVLAIFKAGGVYLPIEPQFPADRIAATLSRAECKLVLTELGSTDTLDQALDSLSEVKTLLIDTAYDEGHDDDDLGFEVGQDQLAYIYFTSGSTGEPKGAMCEHAGMLNHLYAKIDDLEIGEGETVAQVAPQCFDISLWQLVSALIVGGRTLLVSQETILDPGRFIDTIVDGRVAVLQVVPSYLEVLLSYLERNRRNLPELHCVSVTGEALSPELAQRWFATKPAIKLANAYGLTETSDDTNHEVMDRAPDQGGVPLGRAVNNVEVRVVDEHLAPVPLGAPGEIVFSGICVGRGYINDPERTSLAYLADPVREGQRLYRSGDFGRWRPDGKLEYLGRRDAQVKIRGFRIEIGEIENALLRLPAVSQAAVVINERPDQSKELVGFYSGQQLEAGAAAGQLGRSLPEYMIPSALHWRESLPLTDNGKIDRKVLVGLAGELGTASHDFEAPNTAAERQLAAAWAAVLGVPEDQVGRHDEFFDCGGTSLSAVELVLALDNAVTLKEVTRIPVLAELAQLLDGSSAPQATGLLQLLAGPGGKQRGALVCLPYAGGNAINFRAMARSLRGSGLAVYAVELPGHDLTTEPEPFASMEQVVEQVVAEIIQNDLAPVVLWGHSSGAALAVETARELEERGVGVRGLIVAAQLVGEPTDRRASIADLNALSEAEIAADLSSDKGYTELGELDPRHAEQVGAAYRHDCLAAHHYLLDALDTPPAKKLSVPLTVVIAADDPATVEWQSRYRDWELVAEHVDVCELADGGHYFLRTRPGEAADVVLRVGESANRRSNGSNGHTNRSSSSSPLDVDLRPGEPPMLRVGGNGKVGGNGSSLSWAGEHRDVLLEAVNEHGSVTVRGLGLRDAAEVTAAAQALAGGLVAEREAFAARQTFSNGVYSSSEWPPNQQMCMHHELSYRLRAPGLMLFACLAAPTDGGSIGLADSPTVLGALPGELVRRFDEEGWILTRNYTDEIGLSVAEAFGTDDRRSIESYCRENAIEFEWQRDGGLRTSQRRSAVVDHPATGQRCWFNQIAFLNEWTMNPEVREFLVETYGPNGLPFTTRFGNGDPIGQDVVQAINDAYEANTTRQTLQTGDVILVDNIRTAHSREPFQGTREVIVAMGNEVQLNESAQSQSENH